MEARLHLLRHGTFILSIGNVKLLVDPCLDAKGTMPPIPCGDRGPLSANPLVDLPLDGMKLTELLSGVDAILMSHLHKDHFHGLGGFPFLAAKPVLAPNPVAASLARRGFAAKGIGRGLDFGGLRVRATPAAHGRGLSRLLMGKAWGFLVSEPDAPPIYVAGDGLWNASMRRLIDREKPCAVILNAGSARISLGKPITMDSADVAAVLSHAERAKVVAVHLDAFNHCLETREELQNALIAHPGAGRLAVPHDGDELPLED